ncbi:hypothetical protein [Paenibacillus tarimensis]|uniref:hypothetical protein n=1 Tax=Paenibacillus tarimensis TaxID=416012 RepID=UPI001F322342|nr:hypothetical protein [Paenibacillus tarimensis]MCF2946265.1 hypothetical protein [Paenibacillus tarimensis]
MTARKCPEEIVKPPVVQYRDVYHPQPVNVIHPVEIITRHHMVPVYRHYPVVTVRDVWCPPAVADAAAQVTGMRSRKKTRKPARRSVR